MLDDTTPTLKKVLLGLFFAGIAALVYVGSRSCQSGAIADVVEVVAPTGLMETREDLRDQIHEIEIDREQMIRDHLPK